MFHSISPNLVFTLFYFLFCLLIIFPPSEVISAGLTIESIFENWLGSENELFVQYHLRRTALTFLLHSLLPLGYYYGQELLTVKPHPGHHAAYVDFDFKSQLWSSFFIIGILGPVVALAIVFWWSRNDWSNHPISKRLAVYSNNNSNWHSVASDINIEYRRVNKICIKTSSIVSIIATDNWIIKISPYVVDVAHQSDTALIVKSADVHPLSHQVNDSVQFINIEVKPTRRGAQSFRLRLNALDLKDLQSRVTRPIVVLENIKIRRSLVENFLDTFSEEVSRNPLYQTNEELELCIGCMQVTANVKLQKSCDDDLSQNEPCNNCYCKPMWCINCMGRWFASRQEKEASTWLSSKCTCPVCRSRFCILDVSVVQNSST